MKWVSVLHILTSPYFNIFDKRYAISICLFQTVFSFFFFSGMHHQECVAPSASTEDSSGPGRLLHSVWGCRLSDRTGWCSATWYEDALVVSSYLVGEAVSYSQLCSKVSLFHLTILKCQNTSSQQTSIQWADLSKDTSLWLWHVFYYGMTSSHTGMTRQSN